MVDNFFLLNSLHRSDIQNQSTPAHFETPCSTYRGRIMRRNCAESIV